MCIQQTTSQRENLIGPLLNLQDVPAKISTDEILDTIELVVLHSLEGINAFRAGQFHLFDPSIGDEACQIRAFMLLKFDQEQIGDSLEKDKEDLHLLVNMIGEARRRMSVMELNLAEQKKETDAKKLAIKKEKSRIGTEHQAAMRTFARGSEEQLAQVQSFKEQMTLLAEQEKPINKSFEEISTALFKEKSALISALDVSLSSKGRLAVIAYMLNIVKESVLDDSSDVYVLHDKTNLRKIALPGKAFNGTLANLVISKAKQILNQESILLVRSEAQKLAGKRACVLQEAVAVPLPSAKEGFEEISFYHGVEVVMKRIKALGIPVLIKAREPQDAARGNLFFSSSQLYVVDEITGKYVPCPSQQEGTPVMVIEGISRRAAKEGVHTIVQEAGGLMKMVRYNAAGHRLCTLDQHAGAARLKAAGAISEEEEMKIQEEILEGTTKGYSMENCTSYQIEHIFAATLHQPVTGGDHEV